MKAIEFIGRMIVAIIIALSLLGGIGYLVSAANAMYAFAYNYDPYPRAITYALLGIGWMLVAIFIQITVTSSDIQNRILDQLENTKNILVQIGRLLSRPHK